MNRRSALVMCGLTPSLVVSVGAPSVFASTRELAIVVGNESPVSGLSFHELKQLFKGERMKDPKGEWMVPINRQPDSLERNGFDDTVLGMSPDVVKAYWIDRKIRGQPGAPKALKSGALILRVVSKLPGAIGYVLAAEAKGVKLVKIDGKLPGQAGYSIRF